jgi:hypothetical protein
MEQAVVVAEVADRIAVEEGTVGVVVVAVGGIGNQTRRALQGHRAAEDTDSQRWEAANLQEGGRRAVAGVMKEADIAVEEPVAEAAVVVP